jgi:tetratricopeptide (TPR) repeat protein
MSRGRRRLDVELVVDIARVLLGGDAAAAEWRMALQALSGQAGAAGIVRVFPALPDDRPDFTGRRADLRQLLDGLAAGGPGAGPGIAVVEGMPGVGKTTLVVHAGHQLLRRGHGTDLQLWVNLRGYDAQLPPVDPAAVLEGFLRVLGVSGDQIFHLDLAGRAARYQRLMAGRRALVVLDNAATAEQVDPLLPRATGCRTMITSRNTLATLPGARRLPLGTFSQVEALELLRRTVGSDAVDAAPQVVLDIAGLVGRLPLALGVVAGRINDTPDWTLADHLNRLTERHRRRQLDSGIELALESSYHALGPDLQQTLRLLALHCGRDLDAYAAAALAGTDLPTTVRRLDRLLAANLLQRSTPARYQFHDLIQIHASARAIDDEPDSVRRAALTRLLDSYLFTTDQAMGSLYPAQRHRRARIAASPTPTPPIADPAAARAWLVAEHANLLAIVAYTAANGWPTHTTRLSALLSVWLIVGGHYADALTVHGHALDVARRYGDRAAEGVVLMNLGAVRGTLGQYRDAIVVLQQARRICREVGDRFTEGRCHDRLGSANSALGRYPDALKHLSAAAAIYRQIGDRSAEGGAQNNIGDTHERLGHYRHAITHYQQALAISREVDVRALTATVLGGLSSTHARLQRLPQAQEYHRQALALHREHGNRAGEALSLSRYGRIYEADHPETREHHQRAVTIAHEIGNPEIEAEVLNNIGETLRTAGDYDEALRHYQSALRVATEVGNRGQQARAHNGIAHAMHATHQPAHTHWCRALDFYAELDSPLADEIRAHLNQPDWI